jgi:hypothetical protein
LLCVRTIRRRQQIEDRLGAIALMRPHGLFHNAESKIMPSILGFLCRPTHGAFFLSA